MTIEDDIEKSKLTLPKFKIAKSPAKNERYDFVPDEDAFRVGGKDPAVAYNCKRVIPGGNQLLGNSCHFIDRGSNDSLLSSLHLQVNPAIQKSDQE